VELRPIARVKVESATEPENALHHRLAAADAQPSCVAEQSEALAGAQKLGHWK